MNDWLKDLMNDWLKDLEKQQQLQQPSPLYAAYRASQVPKRVKLPQTIKKPLQKLSNRPLSRADLQALVDHQRMRLETHWAAASANNPDMARLRCKRKEFPIRRGITLVLVAGKPPTLTPEDRQGNADILAESGPRGALRLLRVIERATRWCEHVETSRVREWRTLLEQQRAAVRIVLAEMDARGLVPGETK